MESMEKVAGSLTGLQEMIVMLANGAPVTGRAWLQMEMFVLSRIHGHLGRDARYAAGRTGPYSRVVEACLERLVGSGMAFEGAGGITLTAAGRAAAEGIMLAASGHAAESVRSIKEFINAMSADELMCYACMAYKGIVEESSERERIVAGAEDILLGMVWEDKISIGRVAELIDKSIEYVRNKLRSQGYLIPTYC